MTALERDSIVGDFEKLFGDKATELIAKVENKDITGVVGLIQDLQKVSDENLYQEIGRLTRALHESIKNFKLDGNVGVESDIDEAHEGLAYVVDMTSKAANKTMDLVELALPLSEGIATESVSIEQQWQRFLNKELSPSEFRDLTKRISGFFEKIDTNTIGLNRSLSEILLAQDYQDLTGQVINKVTAMVTDVEARLVQLVSMAGHVDEMTGITHGCIEADGEIIDPSKGFGPQINAQDKEDVASTQDDVDDLLSSLGF